MNKIFKIITKTKFNNYNNNNYLNKEGLKIQQEKKKIQKKRYKHLSSKENNYQ